MQALGRGRRGGETRRGTSPGRAWDSHGRESRFGHLSSEPNQFRSPTDDLHPLPQISTSSPSASPGRDSSFTIIGFATSSTTPLYMISKAGASGSVPSRAQAETTMRRTPSSTASQVMEIFSGCCQNCSYYHRSAIRFLECTERTVLFPRMSVGAGRLVMALLDTC